LADGKFDKVGTAGPTWAERADILRATWQCCQTAAALPSPALRTPGRRAPQREASAGARRTPFTARRSPNAARRTPHAERRIGFGMHWRHATGLLTLARPRILGIVNVTPDSFSDGGRLRSLDDARRHVDRLAAEGADVIDIGGESTRPQNAVPVDADEERRRVLPAVAAVRADHPEIPISVDTVKAIVARDALAAGASIVNDVSAFRLDPEMPGVCAGGAAGVVLMHSRGDVADMATFANAVYGDDVVGDVTDELRARVTVAQAAGIADERIVIDPGIGFSKRPEHSLAVLGALARIASLGLPVLVGVSRKRFIGEITGVPVPRDRVAGTTGANVMALAGGARLFRVHDVQPARHALDVAWAILQARA
jgi:dihydropteroate synthase